MHPTSLCCFVGTCSHVHCLAKSPCTRKRRKGKGGDWLHSPPALNACSQHSMGTWLLMLTIQGKEGPQGLTVSTWKWRMQSLPLMASALREVSVPGKLLNSGNEQNGSKWIYLHWDFILECLFFQASVELGKRLWSTIASKPFPLQKKVCQMSFQSSNIANNKKQWS